MRKYSRFLIPSILFLLTVFLLGRNLNKPFWGEHDWNGARYGNIAKNYLRYGYIETKFGQVENGGISKQKDFIYYTHYQPLLPLLISVSYKTIGISESATRLIPLLSTAGLLITIYLIGRSLLDWKLGLIASLLALATPMIRYYGKNPVHEPLALFFASLSFLGLLIYIKNKKPHLMLVSFILLSLTNWSFVFLAFALILFLLKKKEKKMILTITGITLLMFAVHFLHTYLLTGNIMGGTLLDAFFERTSIGSSSLKFNMLGYLLRIRLWSSTLFTNTLLAMSALGLIILFKSKDAVYKKFILSLLIYCLYPIFFANASYIHSYFIYYFILPLSLLASLFVFRIIKYKKILVIIGILLLLGVIFERQNYLSALEKSDGDKEAYKIAKDIKLKTSESDTPFIRPFEFGYSRTPILRFYSDRNIIF